MVFPIGRNLRLRDSLSHRRHQMEATDKKPVYSVKGHSPLSSILKLPLCVRYDIMHLVHLGVARNLLTAIVEKRLMDVSTLSSSVTSIKVPHWFRRKPRQLQELCLWKSQEHKLCLLYYSPFCLYNSYKLHGSQTEKQLMILYVCFSSFIYALSTECVTQEEVESTKEVIAIFQNLMDVTFGAGVRTDSLHALIHLPSQVEHFGSLTSTSATLYSRMSIDF